MAASWGSTARCISPMIPPTTRSFTSPRGTWVSARSTRRSEEHTSELQSPCNLVCRLLLEKKNRPVVRHVHRVRVSDQGSCLIRDRCPVGRPRWNDLRRDRYHPVVQYPLQPARGADHEPAA